MVVAIFAREPEVTPIVGREENHGRLRLNVFGVILHKQSGKPSSRLGIVAIDFVVVLPPIHLGNVERTIVGIPSNVGKVVLGVASRLHIDRLPRSAIEYSQGNVVRGFACHGVTYGHLFCLVWGDVYQRIGSYHGLIHAVEGNFAPIGAPEDPLFDTKLTLMNRLPIDDCVSLVLGNNEALCVLVAPGLF